MKPKKYIQQGGLEGQMCKHTHKHTYILMHTHTYEYTYILKHLFKYICVCITDGNRTRTKLNFSNKTRLF